MFADSFCESGWSNRSHRGWTTVISFAVQALAVGCLLLLPLLYTEGLPRLALFTPLLVPVHRRLPRRNHVRFRLLQHKATWRERGCLVPPKFRRL